MPAEKLFQEPVAQAAREAAQQRGIGGDLIVMARRRRRRRWAATRWP
jgi:hypothetical protein